MRNSALLSLLLSVPLGLVAAQPAQAMKISEFAQICETAPMPCAEIPFIQAYVGGALDLLAALDEDTDYLSPIYCVPARELFDTGKIITFMEAHQNENPSRNAMLLVIQFMEEEGGCE